MCGATYLFGNELVLKLFNLKYIPIQIHNEQVTWEQNLQKCCSLGMQPIEHTTLTEQQCVAEFTKGKETTLCSQPKDLALLYKSSPKSNSLILSFHMSFSQILIPKNRDCQEIGLATITTGPAVPRAAKACGEIAPAPLSRVSPQT